MAKAKAVRCIPVPPLGGKTVKGAIDADKVIAGKPKTTLRNDYTSAKGKFYCGIWTAGKGTWKVKYNEDEFIVLIDGVVRLTGKSGKAQVFRAPEAFVIPKGFEGTWETIKPIRKYYAIAE